MDGDGNVPLLRQRENGGVILVIQRAPRIIGVDLDAVQTVAVQCFSDRLRRLRRGIARVDVREGAEPAGRGVFHIPKIPMDGIDCEFHGHEPRVVQRHDDGFFDMQIVHHGAVSVNVCAEPDIVGVRVCLVYGVGENVDVGVDLFEQFPMRKRHAFASLHEPCRFPRRVERYSLSGVMPQLVRNVSERGEPNQS